MDDFTLISLIALGTLAAALAGLFIYPKAKRAYDQRFGILATNIILAVRSDNASFNARYSWGGKTPGMVQQSSASNPPIYEADATAIGGNRINMDRSASIARALVYNAMALRDVTTSRAVSVLWRVKMGASGTAVGIGGRDGNFMNWGTNRLIIHRDASNQWICNATNEFGQTAINAVNFGTSDIGTTDWHDLVLTWDGTTTANAVKFYIDNTLLGQGTAAAVVNSTFDWRSCTSICVGGVSGANNCRMFVNEMVWWDGVIDPGSVALTSGTGALDGAARTAFVDVASFDGLSSSDPGIGNVRSGTSYTINGVSYTGTMVATTGGGVQVCGPGPMGRN